MSKLEWALSHARRGIRIFPCEPGTKIPAIEGWQQKATTDEAQIREWWTDPVMGWELDRNPATPTGNGTIVIDLDNKGGRNGSLNFATWADCEGWDDIRTYRVGTPSGGEHLWVTVEGQYTNRAGYPAKGVDVRADGGLVLLPGAENAEGTPYTVLEDLPLAPAHPAFVAGLRRWEAPKEIDPASDGGDLDSPYSVSRAIDYLRDHAAIPVEAGTGNTLGYSVAAELKKLGVKRDTAVMLMAQYWNTRHDFPRDHAELREVVTNGFRYGQAAPGQADPRLQFPAIDPAEDQPKGRLYYVRFDSAKAQLRSAYLIKGLLDAGAMSVVYGDSWSGKTFLALDWSHCVATGREWRGHKVRQGLVVYIAAEGGLKISNRLTALRTRYPDLEAALVLVPCPVDLLHPNGDMQAIIGLVRAAEAEYGEPAVLVVIDTLSRAMAGGNENSSDDMGALVMNVDRIRTSLKCHTCLIHHCGKDATKGARGHSLLRAATDTEIEVADRQVSVTKQKDGVATPAFAFDLEVVTLGVDEDGDVVTSCLVRYPSKVEAVMTPDMKDALAALWQACSDEAQEASKGAPVDVETIRKTGVRFRLWVVNFQARKSLSGNPSKNDFAEKRLRTLRTIAEKSGLVEKTSENKYILKSAESADFCG